MKKILLILISIYTFSNSAYLDLQTFSNELSNKSCSTISGPNGRTAGSVVYSSTYSNISNSLEYEIYGLGLTVIFKNCTTVNTTTNPDANVGICQGGNITNGDFVYICNGSDYIPFPAVENGTYDNEGNVVCNPNHFNQDGFCVANPSNGYFDEAGNLQCNSPYVNTDNSCTLPPNTNEDGTCMDGSYKDLLTNTCKPTETTDNNDGSTTTNDGSGETTDYPTGTSVNYNPETGVTTTTYPDGTSTTTYPDGTSTTGGGTDGVSGGNTGGGTGGGSEDTSGENNSDNGSNDLPSDNVANNCNDTNLTLQEKMLCELNEGMKKQNSEADPTNSLNNLMKDLRDNQMQDNTAMNQNLKDIESLNKDIKAINSSQLSTLNVTKNATIVSTGLLNNIDTKLDNLLDSTAENVDNPISTVSDSFDSLTSSFSNINSTYDSLNTEIYNKYSEVKTSIEEGFNFTLQSHEIVSCPINKTIDFSKLGFSNFDLNIDICYYTSQVKPYLYPILFILFSYGFSMSIFNMLRGV